MGVHQYFSRDVSHSSTTSITSINGPSNNPWGTPEIRLRALAFFGPVNHGLQRGGASKHTFKADLPSYGSRWFPSPTKIPPLHVDSIPSLLLLSKGDHQPLYIESIPRIDVRSLIVRRIDVRSEIEGTVFLLFRRKAVSRDSCIRVSNFGMKVLLLKGGPIPQGTRGAGS